MIEFKELLAREKELIDAIIKKELEKKISVIYHPLYEAMEYSVFSGGKRVRPILMKWAAEIGEPAEHVLDKSITAIEYIHTYSLIHDDLPSMDDDSVRRGKPTSHKKFGEAMAILAGDALLTEAFYLLSLTGRENLAFELARNAGCEGMVAGQAADINSEPDIDYINDLKTACLFRAAAVMGGIAGGLDKPSLDKLSEYGINLGRAFQLKDDLLDSEYTENRELQAKASNFVNAAKKALGTIPGTEKLKELSEYVVNRNY
ncbi:MAG: polyprenyl synthetase family protein [Elusimicrobiota bacterium]